MNSIVWIINNPSWYMIMKNAATNDVTNDFSTGDIISASILCGIMLASIIGIGIYLIKNALKQWNIE